jgi:hypothetical protein
MLFWRDTKGGMIPEEQTGTAGPRSHHSGLSASPVWVAVARAIGLDDMLCPLACGILSLRKEQPGDRFGQVGMSGAQPARAIRS